MSCLLTDFVSLHCDSEILSGSNQQAIVRRPHSKLSPGGPIPHNHGEGFDAPPTLERSGSEHRVGRLHPSFLRREGLVRMWSSPCRRDGEVEKSAQMEKRMRDDYRRRTGKEAESFCVL